MLPDPTREHCVTTARAPAKETKFEYGQCYVDNVVFELSGKESQLGYQKKASFYQWFCGIRLSN